MVASRGGGSSGGSGRMRSAMTGLDMYKYVFVKDFSTIFVSVFDLIDW